MGVSENWGDLIFGVLIVRILLLRVLYHGPLFSETPRWAGNIEGVGLEGGFGDCLKLQSPRPKSPNLKPYNPTTLNPKPYKP